MRIAVIGGGASGVFFALKCKEFYPSYNIVIFEKNNKLLKKIYATGNGKCNFANSGELKDKYNNEFVYSLNSVTVKLAWIYRFSDNLLSIYYGQGTPLVQGIEINMN